MKHCTKLVLLFFILGSLFSCKNKLEDKDIPEVDAVMLNSAEPKLNKLTEAIEDDPENPLLYYKRGKIYQELGNYSKALDDINLAIRLDNSQGKFYYMLAKINDALDKNTLAINAAERAVNLGHKEAGVYVLLSELYMESGQYKKAEYYLNFAQAYAPYQAEVSYLKALGNLKNGDTLMALAGFRSAINQKPQFAKPYALAAEIYQAKGRQDSAMYYILQGLKYGENKANLYYVNGKLLEKIGLKESSLFAYETAAQLDSNLHVAVLKTGDYYFEKGDSIKALKYYATYARNNFSNSEVNLKLAGLYEKAGKKSNAIQIYQQLLTADSSNISAKEGMLRLDPDYGKVPVAALPDTIATGAKPADKLTPAGAKPEVKPQVAPQPAKVDAKAPAPTQPKPGEKLPAPTKPTTPAVPPKPKPVVKPKVNTTKPEGAKTEIVPEKITPEKPAEKVENRVQLNQQPIIETAPPPNYNGNVEENKKKNKNKQ